MPLKRDFTNHRSQIANVSIKELVQKYGTPLYVYDASMIRQRLEDLQDFDVIRYAQKACSTIEILKRVRRSGAMVDAVSAFEILRALKAGWPACQRSITDPHPIVYTADIFDQDALDLVAGSAPVHVNCGSISMIEQLGKRAPGRDITLRINPGFGHGHSRKTNTGGDLAKHGIWFEQLQEAKETAAAYSLTISGIHMHIGSGSDAQHLSTVCSAMLSAARQIGNSIKTVSCGGGLPVPYQEGEQYVDLKQYHSLWKELGLTLERDFGHPITLEIEPGRYIVAESGFLITEIRAIKKQDENLFYLVDAGFNNLIRPAMYGSYHPISIARRQDSGQSEEGAPTQSVIVGGPLCESGDIFTQQEGGFVISRPLPMAEVGDYLILEITGAYGAAMASNYNSKPLAPEVLLEDGKDLLIRKKQTFDQLIENEIV